MLSLYIGFIAAGGAVGKFCPANGRNRHGHGALLNLHCDVVRGSVTELAGTGRRMQAHYGRPRICHLERMKENGTGYRI